MFAAEDASEDQAQSSAEGLAKNSGVDSTALWRILDAAANRAAEGLRVVEDFARLGLDDPHLTGLLKQHRHELGETLRLLPGELRLAARETLADVGTGLTTESERSRGDLSAVVTAAWNRVQQSLRTLEEYGKVLGGDFASRCEALRYQTYTLERALDTTQASLNRLQSARLYVLLDGCSSEAEFRQLAEQLIAAGVDVIQLRDKQLDDRELLARARLLKQLLSGSQTLLVMNDRPDLAVLCQADGVHVGQEELTVKDARAIVGPRMLIGVSTHNLEQARQAVLDGANYIGVGPMFPSSTKQFAEFPGLAFAQAVSTEIRLPTFAIGGITAGQLPELKQAGITRVAVGTAITGAENVVQAVQAFRREMPNV